MKYPRIRESDVGRVSRFLSNHHFLFWLFAKATEWWRVFDFTVLNGTFGGLMAKAPQASLFAAQAVPAQKMAFCLRWNLHRLLFCRWASFQ